jgi:hypothetical protein
MENLLWQKLHYAPNWPDKASFWSRSQPAFRSVQVLSGAGFSLRVLDWQNAKPRKLEACAT